MISRLAPRTTREPRLSRVPIARSECPEISGATSGASAGEIGRQVDVHVGEHRRVGRRTTPACSARPRPFCSSRTTRTSVELGGEFGGDARGVVDAGVVGDRDAHRVREVVAQVAVQPVHRVGERGLLVVDRDHHVEHGHAERRGRQRGVRPRSEAGRRDRRGAGSRAMSVMTSMVESVGCGRPLGKLCAAL